MPLTPKRETFTFNHSGQPDEYGVSVGNYETVQAAFDSRAEENLADINNIKETLTNTEDGDSGADNIGMTPIEGLPGTPDATIQAQVEALKEYFDGTYPVPDSSLTDEKLSDAEGQIKERFTSYLANFINIKSMPSPYVSAKGDGVTDDTAAIQAAVTNFRSIFFPVGTYLISDTIRESTNGGQRHLLGENEFNTIIKAADTMLSKPLVWFGNSNGHGNYRGSIEKLTFDGNAAANLNIGIRWHEAGTSITRDVKVTNCDLAIQALGCIGHTIDGNIYIQSCTKGIWFTEVGSGVPASVDDITKTASPTTLNTNISRIFNAWIGGCTEEAIKIQGGLFHLKGCVFQSAVSGGADYDIIRIDNGNESFDYGGGPIIEGCWFEGGKYRYAIAVRNTRAVRIYDNFMSGPTSDAEGGILLSNADNAIVKGNSLRGSFTRAPSEGRLANAPIYVTPTTRPYTCDIDNNYITKNTMHAYFEGVASPTMSKPKKAEWLVCLIAATVPTVVNASSDFYTSVTYLSVGKYRITLPYNRENGGTSKYASFVQPYSTTGQVITVVKINDTQNIEDFRFYDSAGASIDPEGFSYMMFGETGSI